MIYTASKLNAIPQLPECAGTMLSLCNFEGILIACCDNGVWVLNRRMKWEELRPAPETLKKPIALLSCTIIGYA